MINANDVTHITKAVWALHQFMSVKCFQDKDVVNCCSIVDFAENVEDAPWAAWWPTDLTAHPSLGAAVLPITATLSRG